MLDVVGDNVITIAPTPNPTLLVTPNPTVAQTPQPTPCRWFGLGRVANFGNRAAGFFGF